MPCFQESAAKHWTDMKMPVEAAPDHIVDDAVGEILVQLAGGRRNKVFQDVTRADLQGDRK
jgi:hypothetical protein